MGFERVLGEAAMNAPAADRGPIRLVEDEAYRIMSRINALRRQLADEQLPLSERMEIQELVEFWRVKLARLLSDRVA